MRNINTEIVRQAVEKMCIEACCILGEEITNVYKNSAKTEISTSGIDVLNQIIENAKIASEDYTPVCQDTGMVVVFLEIGNEVHFTGAMIEDAINKGVREGYKEGYLRKSVVKHPLNRINTKDNTPAIIYYNFVNGDKVKISLMPKGFGSENMSALAMLKPSDGEEGVIKFVVDTIDKAGPNACPPLFVGVGIGGTVDKAMVMAKKALLRNPGSISLKGADALLEEKIKKAANRLGIGPGGLGGRTTVFDIFVESFPTHIAGLPVAVNICCHSLRHRERIL